MFPVLLTRDLWFPHPSQADEHGLLALGGDLSVDRLLLAYSTGVFPWFSSGEPILWWSPDPRMVLFPGDLHVPRRLRRIMKKQEFHITLDRDFASVIRECAASSNRGHQGTWITDHMIQAYEALHRAGYAHSVEAWHKGKLAGGLYGVCLGAVFFGESMFYHVSDASKVAFVTLMGWLDDHGVRLIDCQVRTGHLARFGAVDIPREDFLRLLVRLRIRRGPVPGRWEMDH